MRKFIICTTHQILGVIKSQRMGWAVHVARTADRWDAYRVW